MIAPSDLRTYIIKPTLDKLEMGGEAAEELLLGTAAQESACGARLVQLGGPALGLWQMEPQTHDDIWINYLRFRAPLAGAVGGFLFNALPHVSQLVGNLHYACAMARIKYARSSLPLPAAGDLAAQAAVYKQVYNTPAGKATMDEYMRNWQIVTT